MGLTLQTSNQHIAVCPLMDPMLEGAAFLLHLRAGLCYQPAFRIHPAVLEEFTFKVSLQCGIWHRVCRPVHQILRNHSVGNTKSGFITSSVLDFDRNLLSELLYNKCGTYSSEKPKFSISLASAANILQYSRIMFWTLHS